MQSAIKKPNLANSKIEENMKILLWRYRYSLKNYKAALPKFLICVNWNVEKEEEEAIRMLDQWAKIDLDDALYLLSSAFCANEYYTKK